jgi:hypothetical protein
MMCSVDFNYRRIGNDLQGKAGQTILPDRAKAKARQGSRHTDRLT